jgi:F-type H+-transporting ATPase subunit delta
LSCGNKDDRPSFPLKSLALVGLSGICPKPFWAPGNLHATSRSWEKALISSAILGRYANSLAEIVFEENIEENVTEDLKTYSEIFRAVPDLLETLHSPAVPHEAKNRILDELIAKYPVNPITSNFLRILLQNNRIRYYQEILNSYLRSVGERKGVLSARVTAAVPLSEEQLKRIQERLTGITGKQVLVELQTDSSLLGGIVVQIGSTHFDGSIRTQLADMRRRLAGI